MAASYKIAVLQIMPELYFVIGLPKCMGDIFKIVTLEKTTVNESLIPWE